jgi:hypothetical protein
MSNLLQGMRLLLCHSARGFNMHHTIDVVERLRGLENLYFDTGAVTEAGATNALLRTFGSESDTETTVLLVH